MNGEKDGLRSKLRPSRGQLSRWDANDPLRSFRRAFQLPPGVVYLDGNSLGALPTSTRPRISELIDNEWGDDLISSWNKHDWIGAPSRVGAKLAGLIGALPHEVIATDSTSINLYKLIVAALRMSRRTVILSEPGNFPTDLYVAEGAAALLGAELRLVDRSNLMDAIDETVGVVLLTHVHYKTAAKHDMAEISARASSQGALTIWDLSHSAGAINVDLNGSHADFAVGCGYKYLNGGPGAPAFAFVAERNHDKLSSPLTGWMGHAEPFAFVDKFEPAPGMAKLACGTPPILGLIALECGIDILAEAGIGPLSRKAAQLTQLFIQLVEEHGEPELRLISPRDPESRGSHVSFSHPEAYGIVQALIARGVIGDFRAPDVARFGFAPLYISFSDVAEAARHFGEVLANKEWDAAEYKIRAKVT